MWPTILARTSPRFARGLVPRARLSLPASSSRFLRRRSFCSIFSGACFSVTESKSTTLGELPHLNGAWHHRRPGTILAHLGQWFIAELTRLLCQGRSEEHTSELQSLTNLVCRLLL